jgi:hypothetical protein
MCQYDNVLWYLWDMGFDTHVAHWHGNNVVLNGLGAGTVTLNPGQSTTVTMNPASWGWWHFLCHFNTHLDKGMEAIYRVYPVNSCPLHPLMPLNSTSTSTATSSMTMTIMPTATGHGNSGYNDTGYGDSGNNDSGNFDSGNNDSGNYDSGNYDTGNNESGNYQGKFRRLRS